MERSAFFNSVNGDRKYKAEVFAEYFASFIANGVFPNPSTGLQVLANNDMSITVKPGQGWINGYYYVNTDALILYIEPADGVLSRVDRVVLRYDVVDRETRVRIKKGDFASSPVAPVLQRDADAYELGLADIAVNKGAISITQADITDLRLNTQLCGIVHGVVEQVDTTTLFDQYLSWYQQRQAEYEANLINWTTDKQNQYDAWYEITTTNAEQDIETAKQDLEDSFYIWFDSIKDVLDGDIANNLLNLINSNKVELDTHIDQTNGAHGIRRGISVFAGNGNETTVAHGLGAVPTAAYAVPTVNPEGCLGEVWIRWDKNNLYIGNSGSFSGGMCWTVLA